MSPSVAPPGFPSDPVDRSRAPVVAEPSDARRALGPRAKWLAGLAGLAAAIVVALLGLGGGSSPLSGPIAEAATVSSAQPGFRMRMVLSLSSPELGVLLSGTARATVDLRDHSSALTMEMSVNQAQSVPGLGSGTLQFGMVLLGTTLYTRLPDELAGALSTSKPWVELDLRKLAGVAGLSSLQSNTLGGDPSHLLDYLRAVSDGVRSDGIEVVDGVPTHHYTATMDFDRVAGLLPADERQGVASLEAQMLVHTAPVDVWVDGADLVRRMVVSLNLGLGSRGSMTEAMQIDFSHYGPQRPPVGPPASEVQTLPGL